MKGSLCKCSLSSSNIKPDHQSHLTLLKAFKHVHVCPMQNIHPLCKILLSLSGFWQCVLTWSLNGAGCELDWSLAMGIPNIWRKGLQESYNCIKGTCQQPYHTLSNHTYPLFLTKWPVACHAKSTSSALHCFSLSLFLSMTASYLFPWPLNPLEKNGSRLH